MHKKSYPYAFFLLCLLWAIGMALVVPVDYDWTLFLRDHRIRALDRFMARTLFEGEGFGGGDPVIFYIFLVLAAYYSAWKHGSASRFYAWRPQLGFLLVSGLTGSMMMVHSLKWVMGRARPALVVKDHLPFTDWFLFGPHFISEGTYRGSFPSGHTAQAFVLVGLAYVMAAAWHRHQSIRLAGWAWGGLSLGYAVLMGITRCMHMSHWLSDVLGALGLSWILTHAFYFRILKIPEQIDHYVRHGRHPEVPKVWELRLCVHLLGMTAGGTALFLGLRAVMLNTRWAFYLLIPAGAVVFGIFCRWFAALYHRVMEAMN
jgi:membrane-associated phospholipid phosphatase